MRRVILKPGEVFSNKHLKRMSAFNAEALTNATDISKTSANKAMLLCANIPSSLTALRLRTSVCRRT